MLVGGPAAGRASAAVRADAASAATVQPAATGSSMALVTSTATAIADEPLTIIATVTADATDAAPSGSVTFTADGANIAGCVAVPLSNGGQSAAAACQAALAPPGSRLAATFTPSPDAAVLGSTSPTVTQPVAHAPLTIALHAARRVLAGTLTTYTARLSVPSPLSGEPTPTAAVAFLDHGTPIAGCAHRPVSRLTATCAVTYHLAGRHAVTAVYAGDATFAAARSASSSVTVAPIPVTGRIAATMAWTFYFTPTYTEVRSMALTGLAGGSTVQLTCHGTGCPPAARRQVPVAPPCPVTAPATCRAGTALTLTPDLAGDKLATGSQLTVSISHPGYVGKYYSFIVQAGIQPKVRIACLAPSSPLPGAGCTLSNAPASTASAHVRRAGPASGIARGTG